MAYLTHTKPLLNYLCVALTNPALGTKPLVVKNEMEKTAITTSALMKLIAKFLLFCSLDRLVSNTPASCSNVAHRKMGRRQ